MTKRKQLLQFAQGDVLFVQTSAKPIAVAADLQKREVILEGEASGHFHALYGRAQYFRNTEMGQSDEINLELGKIAVGKAGATVKHEKTPGAPTADHDEIKLTAGEWKVFRQRQDEGADRETYVED